MCSSTHSLTLELGGCEWSASRPGRFTARERGQGMLQCVTTFDMDKVTNCVSWNIIGRGTGQQVGLGR
jgi:hypothetical protein